MSAQITSASAPGWQPRPDPESAEAFTALFDAYARNVFDYCISLLGDQAEAAAATRATIITACTLVEQLDSRFRVRAWLLALARTECNSQKPGRAEPLPSDGLGLSELLSSWQGKASETGDSDRGESSSYAEAAAKPESPVLAALSELPVLQREVLQLVYRHGVRPTELPAILGISADEARTVLTDAVASFEQSPCFTAEERDQAVGSPAPIEQLASVPLANLPASLWHRTFRAVFDPEAGSYRFAVAGRLGPFRPDGFPDQQMASAETRGKRLVAVSLLLAALLLAPIAAGAVVYTLFSGSRHVAAPSWRGRVPMPTIPATPVSQTSTAPDHIPARHHKTQAKAHSVASLRAAPQVPQPTQAAPHPHTSSPAPVLTPSPTKHPSPSSTPSGSRSPSPTPTPTQSPSPTSTPSSSPTT